MYKKIIPFFLLIATILAFCSPVAFADDAHSSIYSTADMWAYAIQHNIGDNLEEVFPLSHTVADFLSNAISYAFDEQSGYCATSSDHLHHADNLTNHGAGFDEHGSYVVLTCDYCGENFKCYSSDLQQAYADYVDELDFNGINSDGSFHIVHPQLFLSFNRDYVTSFVYSNNVGTFNISANKDVLSFSTTNSQTWSEAYLFIFFPVSGKLSNIDYRTNFFPFSGFSCSYQIGRVYNISSGYQNFASYTGHLSNLELNRVYTLNVNLSFDFYPSYSDSSGNSYTAIYAPSTRIGMTSFNVATVEENEITQVYEDVTILNEENSILYNPVTNETYTINNWNYDYSTRTYTGELDVDTDVDVSGKLDFELGYHDDRIVLKVGDLEFDLNYVVKEEPEPTPTPDPTPVHTPLPSDVDYDTDDTPYWLWLQDWLDNFKSWLGKKLDGLGGSGSDITILYNDNSSGITNYYDYEITYENAEGEEDSFSLRKLFSKFLWVKDVFSIGKEMVSVVSADAAAAYDLNISVLDAADDQAEDVAPNNSPARVRAAAPGIMVDGAPYIPINMAAAQSNYGFDYGGEVAFLDLSWYAPYKSTVDGILGGFLWLFFTWKLFQKLPGIIGGGSMDSSKVEDIEAGKRSR